MKETLAVPAFVGHTPTVFSAAMPARSVDTPTLAVRYRVRPVLWGDRRRYEVVDTHTDTTLVTRATHVGADDDVIVLNMGGGGGPQVRAAPVRAAEEQVGTRQCGICRGIFPVDPAHEPGPPQDWWLCGPCRRTLTGRPPGPASEDAGISWPTGLVPSTPDPSPAGVPEL